MDSMDPSSNGFLRPFIVVASLLPIFFLLGTELAQSAGMLPQLLDEKSSIKINMEEATWIASMPFIGTVVASPFIGMLSDKLGRIRLGQVGYLLFFTGYVIMVKADGFKALILGRFLTGLGAACVHCIGVYNSEISPPTYRGILVSLGPLTSAFGSAFMLFAGGYLPWKIGAGITSIISIFGFILTFFFYESPVWLVRKDKINAARKSLERIGGPANVNTRLRELIKTADSQSKTKFSLKLLADPTVWKPYAMVICMFFLTNAAGYSIVLAYTVHIMREFNTIYDPLQASMVVGIVKFFAMMLASYLLRRMRRKCLGALSGYSSAVILLCIFAYLQFVDNVPYLRENSWIPVGLFFMFVMTITVGIFPVPITAMYECFPIKVRGMMTGVCFCSSHVLIFIWVKSYNFLLVHLSIKGVILLFAVSSLSFGLFSTMILVETHKKTLDEIEAIFVGRKQRYNEPECVSEGQKAPSETLLDSHCSK